MKRNIDLVQKELESENEEMGSSDSELSESQEDEEPRIKDVLNNLSEAVSKKRASDLLHSMATSRDILFWTPPGQLLRNNRTIPVTNIAELVEYVLLPYNEDVTKPRALNTSWTGGVRNRQAVNQEQKACMRFDRKIKKLRRQGE